MTADSSTLVADTTSRKAERLAWAFMALVAYGPALLSSPGRMPADSKLYVYLNPGRFLGDAASTFDPRQFGGWVPHQHMSYLWPTAPWFWVFDRLGVPDWIAHRLWIATLMFAAGSGVWWFARRTLGLPITAALTAAMTYQTSLYLLPYISRTSVMLLPWAGLGWILAFTARGLLRRGWRDPALIALVVLTVGGVNATALALIVPGPVLWLVHSLRIGIAKWADVWRVSWRTAVLSLGVSLWWIVMLTIQGRYGADVLAYSESLADVSYTSTAPEVTRGLGYWLFYIRDNFGPATTSSLRYLISTPAILLSFAVTILGLVGLATTRWAHRTYALALVAAGAILAVGVHPIDDESPLMHLVSGGGQGGLALALRSSTRALPLMVLGLALGLASLVAAAAKWELPSRASAGSSTGSAGRRMRLGGDLIVATVVVLLVLANNPSLLKANLVDPAIDRDQSPPSAWTEAAAAIDAAHGTDDRSRVLQLPGVEFGAFRWGYTVDQPLPALTKAGLVTRDLLPLGSPSTMDLLYALDDRVQDGVLEPNSVAPVSRLLGVDTIWLTNDVEYERFGTTRPQRLTPVLDAAPGLSAPTPYGPIEANRPSVPVVQADTLALPDQPTTPVALYQVDDPRPNEMVADSLVVLSGSGAGVVDAAAADLIDGLEPLVYSANLETYLTATSAGSSNDPSSDPSSEVSGLRVDRLIVSDSNRDQARQWRSSQDAVGFTESGGPEQGVLRPLASDRRFDLFGTSAPATQTVAIQQGPISATATAYGEPFRYLPEHRPYMAIDGDPSTSWTVGDHGDPIGEAFQLSFATPLAADTSISLAQAGKANDRIITNATFEARSKEGHIISTWPVTFDAASRTPPGQAVTVPAATAELTIRIDAVDAGVPFTESAVAGVGFSEIAQPLGPTVEVVRVPSDGVDGAAGDAPVDYVFTRWRADPFDRARSDPEPNLLREFKVANRSLTAQPTVRVDPRASDDELSALFDLPVTASGHLLGSIASSANAAVDSDPNTMWITPFDEAVGSNLRIPTAVPTSELTVRQPLSGFSPIQELNLAVGSEQRTVALTPNANGDAVVTVDPPLPPGNLVVTITAIKPFETLDRRYGDPTVTPAAISVLSGPSIPIGTAFTELTFTASCVPIATVGDATITATLEFAAGQSLDDPVSAKPCPTVLNRDGSELSELKLDGVQLLGTASNFPPGLQLDRVVLREGGDARPSETPVNATATGDTHRHDVVVDTCTDGCWLIDDVAANPGWAAADGSQKLSAIPAAGSGQAWHIPPASDAQTVSIRWTQQRKFDLALLISLITSIICVVLAVRGAWSHRRTADDDRRSPSATPLKNGAPLWVSPFPFGRRVALTGDSAAESDTGRRVVLVRLALAAAAGGMFAGVLVQPIWAIPGATLAVLATVVGRRLIDWLAISIVGVTSLAVAWGERRESPLPDGGWPHHFESWHQLAMFAIALVALAAVLPDAPADDEPT